MAGKLFSRISVAQHTSVGDLWVIIDSRVYDVSSFASVHPGGLAVLADREIGPRRHLGCFHDLCVLSPSLAGQDVTEQFFSLHRAEVLDRYSHLQIGILEDERPSKDPILPPGYSILIHKAGIETPGESLSGVPYADPTWLSPGYHTPYYKDHHRRFQVAVRKFVEEVVFPDAQICERGDGRPSQEVIDELCRLNILAMKVGPGKHLEGRVLMDGIISLEQFDAFHELILTQEFARLHARGYSDGLGGGTIIGLPPVISFAEPPLRDRIVQDALSGKKPICLAVTEAFAGSDVQGLRCRAMKVKGGWVVNGTKKWITNSMWAHYFTTACKADNGEIVVLVIERGEGVQTRPIKTAYASGAAGTGYIMFDNVWVPDGNRLGAGHPGLNIILQNFNHERWILTSHSIAGQRIIFEECFKWATQRKVFGKPLSSQPVVRQKLAGMISRVESCQSWLENITYQMVKMSSKEQAKHLAGQIAFLKMHATKGAQITAADAVQILGGRALTQTGMGRFIEHNHRTSLIDAVGGGSEAVLGDLGVRQALRSMPPQVRM
ncbi:acyl-CoA dehydrogenase/oxidase [Mycena belliarum]|uniref:Acyl-CoA dehydrogenase/oxidase n=1 Tax=Mycena belliarum TaxID=1033014 RepID=A0AAD6UJG4_9AGAR|nr:acyl-CoA dehydrogenase/oxidase [Mycena belliae]